MLLLFGNRVQTSFLCFIVVEFGDDIRTCLEDRTLVIANHQSTADVPLLMATFNTKKNVLPNLMWIMDRIFKYTNFGIVSILHEDFFIVSVSYIAFLQCSRVRLSRFNIIGHIYKYICPVSSACWSCVISFLLLRSSHFLYGEDIWQLCQSIHNISTMGDHCVGCHVSCSVSCVKVTAPLLYIYIIRIEQMICNSPCTQSIPNTNFIYRMFMSSAPVCVDLCSF